MTVELEDGVIRLSGRCRVEEAEQLLEFLSQGARSVDLAGCEHMHAALFQVLLAAQPEIRGPVAPFIERWLLPLIKRGSPAPPEPSTDQTVAAFARKGA